MLISGMTPRKRSLVSVLAGMASLAVARPLAQQVGRAVEAPAPAALTVDFIAVSKSDARTPILDLTKEAVTLRVAGRNRVITNLELVSMDESSPAAAPAAAAPAFPAPFATNLEPASSDNGRRVVFVIDTESIRPGEEGPLRAAVKGFLARLGPRDQVGVVAVPRGGMNVDVTRELDRVRDAFSQFTGAASASQTTVQATDRTRLDLQALAAMLRGMSGSERPTTVIFVASSLMGPSGTPSLGRTRNDQGDLQMDTFQLVSAAVGAARAQVFAVQIEGGMTISDASASTTNQGLASLAGVGGGEFFSHLALGDEDAIARIGRETSAYYVATFAADARDRSGTQYPIALSSSRADVRFLSRPGFELVKPVPNTSAPLPVDMLNTMRAFRDLPMRAVGYSARPVGIDRERMTWVRALAEVATPGAKVTAASARLYKLTGEPVSKYDLTAAELAKPVLEALLEAPPGQYRLRFAATDGKTSGAVDYPIEVRLTPAGALKMSSLMIQPHVQFSTEPEAWAVFELYGQNTGQQLSIEVFLIGAGPEPKRLEAQITTPPREADTYLVRARVPLTDLPPGDYQVRATVDVAAQPAVTIAATLRKVK